jgi:hypothetical protein
VRIREFERSCRSSLAGGRRDRMDKCTVFGVRKIYRHKGRQTLCCQRCFRTQKPQMTAGGDDDVVSRCNCGES